MGSDGNLVHLDVRTSSAGRRGAFTHPTRTAFHAIHPRGRGFVMTELDDTSGCSVITLERDTSGELQIVAREEFAVPCWTSHSLLVGALYLGGLGDEVLAVMPGSGSSYAHRFTAPYDITSLSQAEDALVFTTPNGVGVMTPACAP